MVASRRVHRAVNVRSSTRFNSGGLPDWIFSRMSASGSVPTSVNSTSVSGRKSRCWRASSTLRRPLVGGPGLPDADLRLGQRRPVDAFDGERPQPIVAPGQVEVVDASGAGETRNGIAPAPPRPSRRRGFSPRRSASRTDTDRGVAGDAGLPLQGQRLAAAADDPIAPAATRCNGRSDRTSITNRSSRGARSRPSASSPITVRYVCCGQRSEEPRSQRDTLSRAACGASHGERRPGPAGQQPGPRRGRPSASGSRATASPKPPGRARLAHGQPDHRRRGRRSRLAQQVRELEHVGDLLAGPRPVAIERHRQRELVEPRRPPPPDRTDAEEREDPRDAHAQQDPADRHAESEPPVEEHQHGRRRHRTTAASVANSRTSWRCKRPRNRAS